MPGRVGLLLFAGTRTSLLQASAVLLKIHKSQSGNLELLFPFPFLSPDYAVSEL